MILRVFVHTCSSSSGITLGLLFRLYKSSRSNVNNEQNIYSASHNDVGRIVSIFNDGSDIQWDMMTLSQPTSKIYADFSYRCKGAARLTSASRHLTDQSEEQFYKLINQRTLRNICGVKWTAVYNAT